MLYRYNGLGLAGQTGAGRLCQTVLTSAVAFSLGADSLLSFLIISVINRNRVWLGALLEKISTQQCLLQISRISV